MIALGNDVIDLAETPRNGLRYYRRLQSYAFSAQELEQFRLNRNLPEQLAIGWSVKEAAYKSVTKLIGRKQTVPKSFHFEVISETPNFLTSSVRFEDFILQAETSLTDFHVHSLCYLVRPRAGLVVGIGTTQPDYKNQSSDVRTLALQAMTNADRIRKSVDGVPYFERGGKPLATELSLSHHGRWVAFAYQS